MKLLFSLQFKMGPVTRTFYSKREKKRNTWGAILVKFILYQFIFSALSRHELKAAKVTRSELSVKFARGDALLITGY